MLAVDHPEVDAPGRRSPGRSSTNGCDRAVDLGRAEAGRRRPRRHPSTAAHVADHLGAEALGLAARGEDVEVGLRGGRARRRTTPSATRRRPRRPPPWSARSPAPSPWTPYAAGCAWRSAGPARRARHAERSGAPMTAAIGRTNSGARVATPRTTPTVPTATRTAGAPPNSGGEQRRRAGQRPARRRRRSGSGRPRNACGPESRSASTGSTLVARRAGATAATTVTTVPTSSPTTTAVAARAGCPAVGRLKPEAAHQGGQPARQPDPEQHAERRGDQAEHEGLRQHACACTWRRVAPIARSSASSRVRWATCIEKVFQMMKDPTNSAIAGEAEQRDVEEARAPPWPPSACSSATAWPVSGLECRRAARRRAATSARSSADSSAACTLIVSKHARLPSTRWAVRQVEVGAGGAAEVVVVAEADDADHRERCAEPSLEERPASCRPTARSPFSADVASMATSPGARG